MATRLRFDTTASAATFELLDCLTTRFPLTPSTFAVLNVHSQDHDFDDGDRDALRLLRTHIGALVRAARDRRRLADLTRAVETDDAARGFLLLGPGTSVDYVSPPAQNLLERWFEWRGGRPPRVIADWLRSGSFDIPLETRAEGKRLIVEAVSTGAVVLSEIRVPPSSLTPRELDVLRHAAAGKSTKEIARELWVTPATMSKHFEHAYRKLGVTNRSAALAAVGVSLEALSG